MADTASPSTPTKGGSRPNSGAKKHDAYRRYNLCCFPTKGEGKGCARPVTARDQVACPSHRDKLHHDYPELESVLLAAKKKYAPFPLPNEEINADVDKALSTLWVHYYWLIETPITDISKASSHVVSCYNEIYTSAMQLDIKLSDEQETHRHKVECRQTVLELEEAKRENEANMQKDKAEKEAAYLEQIAAAQAIEQAELKRKADAAMKKAQAAKLANDIDELTAKVERVDMMDITPQQSPEQQIRAVYTADELNEKIRQSILARGGKV
jgi:hypothetical protein